MKTIAKGKTHLKTQFQAGQQAAQPAHTHGRKAKTVVVRTVGFAAFGLGAASAWAQGFVKGLTS